MKRRLSFLNGNSLLLTMPIFHAETIIFENRHEKIGLTVMRNGQMA